MAEQNRYRRAGPVGQPAPQLPSIGKPASLLEEHAERLADRQRLGAIAIDPFALAALDPFGDLSREHSP